MNKIDEQLDELGQRSEGAVSGLSIVSLSAPGSLPVVVDVLSVHAMDQRSQGADPLQTVSSGAAASRRVWLRRGLVAASPVVSSLVSMPVHAATACVLPSGFQSAATLKSRNPNATTCTRDQGPNFWALRDLGLWPTGTAAVVGGVLTAILLKDAFGVGKKVELNLNDPTLKEVLLGGTMLAKYAVAAYLNALKPTPNFPLTAAQAIAVYKSYRPGPVTAPLVLTWNELQAVDWLANLMP